VIRLVVVTAASFGLILLVAFVASRLLRSRRSGLSIRMQVFLALAAIVGTFAFGLGLMVIDRVESRAQRLAHQAAEDEATVIAAMVASEVARGTELRQLASQFEQEHLSGAHLTVELMGPSRELFFSKRGGPHGGAASGTVSVERPVVVGGARVGTVRVIKETLVIEQMLADFAPFVLVISLVLGAAAALAAAWIGRAIAAPIEALSLFGERVSSGDHAAPPPVASGREVIRLRQSIDSMRRQLQGRPFVEAFAADLSHELKNPVAAIRASAEVLDDSALDDPEAARRFVARIRESTARIERLLGELLSLARIEARGIEGLDTLELGALVRGIVGGLEHAQRVDLSVTSDLRVRGDAGWIARAVSNLIDNALVHSPQDTRVSIRVGREGPDALVAVRSVGSVPKHVAERAFNRFVTTRADKGGTGLGLAIVRAVAEAHAGRAELATPGPPAVEFRLLLPEARAAASAREGAGRRDDQKSKEIDEIQVATPKSPGAPVPGAS
jgi:two-component system, OmpR family, sensor histidine kinase CreC